MKVAILAGGILGGISQFVIQIMINKNLGVDGLGTFALIGLYITPLGYFLWASIRQRLASGLINKSQVGTLLSYKVLYEPLVYLLALFIIMVWFELESELLWFYGLILLGKHLDSLFEFFMGCYQQLRLHRRMFSLIFGKVILILASYFLAFNGFLWVSALAFVLIVYLSVKIYATLYPNTKLSFGFKTGGNPVGYGRFLVMSLGFSSASLLMSMNVSVPRFFVEQQFGLSFLGAFYVAWHFVIMGSLVINALNQSSLTEYSHFRDMEQVDKFWQCFAKRVAFIFIICLVASISSHLMGHWVLSTIYDEQLADKVTDFNLLNMSAYSAFFVYLGSASSAALFVFGNQKNMMLSYGVTLLMNVLIFAMFGSDINEMPYLIYISICLTYLLQTFMNLLFIKFEFKRYRGKLNEA